jgi:hypothetical protein
MPTSPSQRIRRMAQKALRRKAIIAEKRKAGATMSGGEALQINGASRAPVKTCVMAQRLFAVGIGWVVLARTLPSGQVGASFFLVDVWCLGVKDAFFLVMPQLAFEERMRESSRDQPVIVIDPSVGRKLLHDAVAYAGSFGLAPSKGFTEAEALFGDTPLATKTFSFGKDGKPFFMSGPNDSSTRIRNIMDRLVKSVGRGGFDYIVNVDGFA